MSKEKTSGGGGGGGKPPSAGKVTTDRRTAEKDRRTHMKDLCTGLFSLLPPQHFTTSKVMPSLPDQIDGATSYIKRLRERVEELRLRKERAVTAAGTSAETDGGGIDRPMMELEGLSLPVIELKEIGGSDLQVNVVSKGCQSNDKCDITSCLVLSKLVSILQEEGAEVVGASFAHKGYKVFCTIHARAKISRIGIETSSVRARLVGLSKLV